MKIDEDIRKKVEAWTDSSVFDKATCREIGELLENHRWKELADRFYRDLSFGTGGMRAVVGAGSNRLNSYNIWRASQAVADEIGAVGEKAARMVVIGHDCRNSSRHFAEVAAGTFAGNGIKVLIYGEPTPVPLVSFAVRHHQGAAGVMITASHNPPEYNGYKVYWSDGTQVTSPQDEGIMNHFNARSDYSQARWMDFSAGLEEGIIEWVGESTERAYFDAIRTRSLHPDLGRTRGEELGVIYTALHGTGNRMCLRALEDLGLKNVESVQQQSLPDGNFPTVSSPNPENPEALKCAVDLMLERGADIAMGTDPDTDRVGVAVVHHGEVFYPNGNQLGILILHYLLRTKSERGALGENPYFVKTVVTTPLQEAVANSFSVGVENTLTGFKWICRRMNTIEREQPERNFIFATEESFGYLHHPFVRDKDGVASTTLIAEVALWYKVRGQTLMDALEDIYREYGFSEEKQIALSWSGQDGAERIRALMERFRCGGNRIMAGQTVEVVEDYLVGQKTDALSGQTSDLDFPTSNVLGFHFAGGTRLYLRPSGTEPKIKFYLMVHQKEGTLEEQKSRAALLIEKLSAFVHEEAEKV